MMYVTIYGVLFTTVRDYIELHCLMDDHTVIEDMYNFGCKYSE